MQRLVVRHPRVDPPAIWELCILPIMRYRRLTYVIVGTALLVTAAYCLLTPNRYSATATILPSGKPDQVAQLSQLAAGTLADVGLGSFIQAQENSSALYPRILSSRLIGERMLQRTFVFHDGDHAVRTTLQDLLAAPNTDIGLRQLSKMVEINLDRTTGFITLTATSKYPELSAGMANAYLDELNNYNINYRQSKARDNERFVTGRLREVKQELLDAEDSLRLLQQQNLNYLSAVDPTLRTELARLERDVKVKEAVFLSLSEKSELAKLEAVKDVPVIQILDRGDVPDIKSAPRRSIYLLGALFGSIFVSVILSLWLDYAERRRLKSRLTAAASTADFRLTRTESAILERAGRLFGVAPIASHPRKNVETVGVDDD